MTSLDQLSSDWDELSNEYKDLEVINLNISNYVENKNEFVSRWSTTIIWNF